MADERYPQLRISGGPYERGEQYGRLARDQIHRSRDIYEAAFRSAADWSWPEALETARTMVPVVQDAYPEVLSEMAGIAAGSELDPDDILTMNCRTEIMWAASVRRAEALGRRGECSSFALLPSRTADGNTLVGQNWDWLDEGRDTVVVLEVEPDTGPSFVTVVEAGLLAKTSLNSSGLAVATNALVMSDDRGQPGIPYHVMLRALARCETVTDAVAAIQGCVRASSANYLLGHADGVIVNIEAAAGDHRGVHALLPEDGALWHTNHFVKGPTIGDEVSVFAMPDTLTRYQRIEQSIGRAQEPATIDSLRVALSDHAGWPESVCCHPNVRSAEPQRWSTVMAVVMDPGAKQMWLASGTPCEHPFERLDFSDFLDRPPSVGADAYVPMKGRTKELA